MKCRSVGWLLHDTKECKVVVPHLSEENHAEAAQQGCGDMTIPTQAIIRMIDLAIPESVKQPVVNRDGEMREGEDV